MGQQTRVSAWARLADNNFRVGIALRDWTTVQWRSRDRSDLVKVGWFIAIRTTERLVPMTEKIKHELISRRQAFPLFGLAAALDRKSVV